MASADDPENLVPRTRLVRMACSLTPIRPISTLPYRPVKQVELMLATPAAYQRGGNRVRAETSAQGKAV
jgi:hypothetical protein